MKPSENAAMRALLAELATNFIGAAHAITTMLDEMDGDPDDEQTDAEDDFRPTTERGPLRLVSGPGCPLAEPAEDKDPDGKDPAA